MSELVLHDRPIVTVFDLLGRDENDMTASLGWGLAHNTALLQRFIDHVAPGVVMPASSCSSARNQGIGPTLWMSRFV